LEFSGKSKIDFLIKEIRGLIGTTVPEALSIWKILANGLAIFLIIVPLNLLGYYLKTEKYKKNKKKQQDMIEMILVNLL